MKTKYGNFTANTVEDYKRLLHKKLFWLLLYKDPKTAEQYSQVDYNHYFNILMKQLKALESILTEDTGVLIELMSQLQAAYNETLVVPFHYDLYRKFVLDAHSTLDKLKF